MATRLLTAQVQRLYARLPVALAAVLVNSAIVFLVLRGSVTGTLLGAWMGAVWLLTALRLSSVRWYRRHSGAQREPAWWARLFTVGSGLNGIAWGASAVLFFGQLGLPERFFLAVVLAGMTAGAAESSSGYPPSFLAFAAPALAPLAARLLLAGSRIEMAIGAMGVVFAGAVWAIARSGGRRLTEALTFRFQNESLLKSLTAARERLAAVNAGLEKEVRERTTQLVQMERQLAQTALLASVGSLAASVAHDINSPLSSVISNLGYLEREAVANEGHPDGASFREALAEARAGAARVRDIVRNLGELARLDRGSAEPLDVREILDSCVTAAGSEVRHRARVVRDYADVPRVKAARAGLTQVLLSLVVNAARAIPPGNPQENQIVLRTRWASDEQRVVVEVADTGAEIPDAERSHLFDLFSLRKVEEENVRMGLPLCHSIVAGLGGRIAVRAGKDRGSVFVVALPASAEEEDSPHLGG